jgi:ABC-type cobalamin/Fe3+-siderophores transport system ATPase subunit
MEIACWPSICRGGGANGNRLLAIHLSRRWCQWKSLLLDDPVQHIDDYRALNLVEVLAAIRRSGRQILVAVEDAALADLLCRRLRSSIGEIGRRFELQTPRIVTTSRTPCGRSRNGSPA